MLVHSEIEKEIPERLGVQEIIVCGPQACQISKQLRSVPNLDVAVDRCNALLSVHDGGACHAVFWDRDRCTVRVRAGKLLIEMQKNIDALLEREQFIVSRVPNVQVLAFERQRPSLTRDDVVVGRSRLG